MQDASTSPAKSSRTVGGKYKGKFGKLFKFSSAQLIALLLLSGVIGLRFYDPTALQMLRARTFDIFQQIQPRQQTPGMVTIVDVDEDSLQKLGQWPWPRTMIADILSRLTDMGALAVGFDVVFAEPDRMSPQSLLAELPSLPTEVEQKLQDLPSHDTVFANAVRSSRVVLGQTGMPYDRKLPDNIPKTSVAVLGKGLDVWVENHKTLLRNIPEIDHAALGHGVFTVAAETDGVVRRVPMILNVQGQYFPSLSLELLRVVAQQQSILVKVRDDIGVSEMRIRGLPPIRTDANGRVWVYYSETNPAQYLSAYKVLDGTAPIDSVRNRIILFGSSASGMLDIKSTPLNPFLPGVEVHAQILENILTQTQLVQPRDAAGVEITIVAVVGLLLIVFLPVLGARLTMGAFLLTAIGILLWSWYNFTDNRLLYDPVYPLLAALLVYVFLTYSSYSREESQRRQVRTAFSHYMSPALVERLAENPDQLKLGGEMRDMTLLFCDVRGFTTISEQFDAQGLTSLINRFLTPMTKIILDRQGTIDKYMGDCIMAFWNAPLDDPLHHRNACDSALAMTQALSELNVALEIDAKREGRKHIPIHIGIGINSGEVCVGNMGSDQRFDYSVLGDDVNLASRLEGQSKTYGVTTVIGENTERQVRDYAVLELDKIRVKGKTIPVQIYGLIGGRDLAENGAFVAHKQQHQSMVAAYRSQDWQKAVAHCNECRETEIGRTIPGLYDLYAERISEFCKASPGSDWDGVFVATSK